MITLVAKWIVKKGCENEAIAAVKELAREVEKEKGVLVYLVHTPDFNQYICRGEMESLPTPSTQEIIFLEQYVDQAAFCEHINSAMFQDFLKAYSHLFLGSGGQPFLQIEFLHREGGFIRPEAVQDH
jgi:quinol monooxygenase YgiN